MYNHSTVRLGLEAEAKITYKEEKAKGQTTNKNLLFRRGRNSEHVDNIYLLLTELIVYKKSLELEDQLAYSVIFVLRL